MLIIRSSNFENASQCLDFFRDHFVEYCELDAIGTRAGEVGVTHRRKAPKYLFRGECGLYQTTVSSLDRLANSQLEDVDREQLKELTSRLAKWFASKQSNFELQPHDAEGLVQHLGLPTQYIDFSSVPEVAVAFSVGGPEEKCQEGQICVLDVQTAMSDGGSQIADFVNHRWSERARRQGAYGYGPILFPDLKSQSAIDQLGLKWFKFKILDADRVRFADKYRSILDAASDPVAGVLRQEINDYVAEKGKLRPSVAEWCANHVPMVPLVAKLMNFCQIDGQNLPEEIEFLAPSKFVQWDENLERDWSLRYWSEAFTEILPQTYFRDYFSLGIVEENGIFVFPATHHSPVS